MWWINIGDYVNKIIKYRIPTRFLDWYLLQNDPGFIGNIYGKRIGSNRFPGYSQFAPRL